MIVDSSALIAFFVEDDQLHAEAISEFKRLENETFIIPDRILEETLTVLIYDRGTNFALSVLQQIRENKRMRIQYTTEPEQLEVFEWMAQLRKKISFQDYVVLYHSVNSNQSPLSFDRELISLYRKITA